MSDKAKLHKIILGGSSLVLTLFGVAMAVLPGFPPDMRVRWGALGLMGVVLFVYSMTGQMDRPV